MGLCKAFYLPGLSLPANTDQDEFAAVVRSQGSPSRLQNPQAAFLALVTLYYHRDKAAGMDVARSQVFKKFSRISQLAKELPNGVQVPADAVAPVVPGPIPTPVTVNVGASTGSPTPGSTSSSPLRQYSAALGLNDQASDDEIAVCWNAAGRRTTNMDWRGIQATLQGFIMGRNPNLNIAQVGADVARRFPVLAANAGGNR